MKEQAIIFEGFRNDFVLQAPSQSPCISLEHNLKHPLLDSEQTGGLWILDSKGKEFSPSTVPPIFSAAFYPNFYVPHS